MATEGMAQGCETSRGPSGTFQNLMTTPDWLLESKPSTRAARRADSFSSSRGAMALVFRKKLLSQIDLEW
jgi:hypothetical protein